MSEHSPEQPQNRFWYTLGDESYPLTPEFADMYLHNAEPWYDHIYLNLPDDEDGNARGGAIWRIEHENFDDVIGDLIQQGGEPYLEEYASQGDKDYFARSGRELPENLVEEPEQPENSPPVEPVPHIDTWISPRQQRIIDLRCAYVAYLLSQSLDFEGTGY